MSLATDAILDIREALEEYGTNITLRKTTEGAFNPVTGDTSDVIIDESLKTLIGAYSSLALFNSDIRASDVQFKVYTTTVIDYNDVILLDGVEYKILNIDKQIFQGENLMYIIQGRA